MNIEQVPKYKYRIILSGIFALLLVSILVSDWLKSSSSGSFALYGFAFILVIYGTGWIFDTNWWRQKSYITEGVLIGLIIAILKLPFFILFGDRLPEWILSVFSKVPDEALCYLFDLGQGEPCGFFGLYYGWIYNPLFYGLVGLGIGALLHVMRKK